MKSKTIITILAFAVIIGLVIYASAAGQQMLLSSVNSLGIYFEEHQIAGGFIFFAISILAVLISPFSSVPLVPSAVLAWGNWLTLILLLPAWIVGGILAYYLGSYSREKIIRHFISFEKVEHYRKSISFRTQFWLVLLFRLAVPSEVAGYTLGIVRYEFKKYLLATFLAELPVALLVVYSSSVLLQGKVTMFVAVIIAAAAILYLAYFLFQKKIKGRK